MRTTETKIKPRGKACAPQSSAARASTAGPAAPRTRIRAGLPGRLHRGTRPSRGASAASLERIDPAQLGKAREIGVVRVKLGLVLDRQGGKLHVGGQIGGHSEVAKKAKRELDMPRTRQKKAHLGTLKPGFDARQAIDHRQRWIEHSRIGRDANETEQGRTGETDLGLAGLTSGTINPDAVRCRPASPRPRACPPGD